MSLVAIVGRPNVGKSTLFNRLTESKRAIVHDEPGVTRDRVYASAVWNGVTFDVVDTGGFVPHSSDRFEQAIREQVHIAVQEADALLFVTDVTTGVTDPDTDIAEILRKTSKPVFVVANKADNQERRWESPVFYELGVGEVFPVSATNGTGTGELLDSLVAAIAHVATPTEPDDRPHLAVVGRPNVGKSSLVNALLGEERSIVTEIAGTTRDAVDSVLRYHGQDVVLVDTAGLRRRSRVRENVEFYSVLRTERAIRRAHVAILLLDATQGLEMQDIRVLKRAEEMRKGLLVVVNKWDLIEKDTNTARDYMQLIRDRLKTLEYVPVLFVSALTKQRVGRVLETALEVVQERKRRISTSKLNDVLQQALARHAPPMARNRPVRIKYATQVASDPPVLAFFCNQPKGIRDPYRRYLENRIREAFGFTGVPITLVFKSKSRAPEQP